MKPTDAPGAKILFLRPMPKIIQRKAPNRLREWRKRRKLTLQKLADLMNTTAAEISRFELGDRTVSVDWLRRFAQALSLPGDEGARLTIADLLNPEDGGLDPQERELVDTLREVPEASRRMFYSLMESQQPYRGPSEVLPLRANGDHRNGKD